MRRASQQTWPGTHRWSEPENHKERHRSLAGCLWQDVFGRMSLAGCLWQDGSRTARKGSQGFHTELIVSWSSCRHWTVVSHVKWTVCSAAVMVQLQELQYSCESCRPSEVPVSSGRERAGIAPAAGAARLPPPRLANRQQSTYTSRQQIRPAPSTPIIPTLPILS